MAVSVKICGITSAGAADAAIAAGAAYGGLVFHPHSPRNLAIAQAGALAGHMRGRAAIVALVADPTDEMLTGIAASVAPDFFQLHGAETAQRVSQIRAKFGPVIKALPVAQASDFDIVPDYESVADMLMFDAKPPSGALRGGGHGAAFDWTLLRGRSFTKPWFLAGGLNPGNAARAIELSGAQNVDVSSGVESAPGVKDAQLIRDFITAAKNPVRA